MRTDLKNSQTDYDCVALMNMPVGMSLDACDNYGDCCSMQLGEIDGSDQLDSHKLLQSLVTVKAGIIVLSKVIWAAPWSVWALALGMIALLTGGKVQWSGEVLEFWGGFLSLFLKYFPFVAGSPVATFGHVVLGRSQRHLEACRPHQLIHVKQYERWGPLFVPAYITFWVILWFRGKHPYYDNPFEREAYGHDPISILN
jgi:hypothetical protein